MKKGWSKAARDKSIMARRKTGKIGYSRYAIQTDIMTKRNRLVEQERIMPDGSKKFAIGRKISALEEKGNRLGMSF